MTKKLQSPTTKAIPPDSTVLTLDRYRRAHEHGTDEYAPMVRRYYELVTDFYEFGWGPSFHFAPSSNGASFAESIASHQNFLADSMSLVPGMNVLDVGCGVGGPLRAIAKKYGVRITGLNISEYQLQKCEEYNRKSGLEQACHTLLGDFMAISAEGQSFDAAYHIEAIAHAPDKKAAYEEIFRVLKPGATFVGYDWCMTPLYDAENVVHREIKKGIEYGNALPQIVAFSDVNEGLQSAGFELLETHDRANVTTLRGFSRSSVGRKVISTVLSALESLRAVPQGTFETYEILNIAADNLVKGGRLGIFTPMYFHKARKPN